MQLECEIVLQIQCTCILANKIQVRVLSVYYVMNSNEQSRYVATDGMGAADTQICYLSHSLPPKKMSQTTF